MLFAYMCLYSRSPLPSEKFMNFFFSLSLGLMLATTLQQAVNAMQSIDADPKSATAMNSTMGKPSWYSLFIADHMPKACIPLALCQLIESYVLPKWKLKVTLKINEEFYTKPETSGTINSLAHMIYKGKQIMISGSSNFNIQLWDLESGMVHTSLVGHNRGVIAVAYVHSKNMLISGSRDNSIKLWNIDGDAISKSLCIKTLTAHTDWVRSIAVSPDKASFASGSDDTTVRLWSLPDGKLLHTFVGHTNDVRTVSWNCDGTILVSATSGRQVHLWDVQKKILLGLLPCEEHIWRLTCSPIVNYVALKTNNEELSLRDIGTGEIVRSMKSPKCKDLDHEITFSPKGTLLASICNEGPSQRDGCVSIWDVGQGKLLAQLPGNNRYEGLHFVSEDTLIASGRVDGTVNVFSIIEN